MLLSYAVYRMDVVFILGQSMGLLVYVRNLVLIYRNPVVKSSGEPVLSDDVHRAR
jgi:lipid-A-disaccharide synthase-like uncharacterized protein